MNIDEGVPMMYLDQLVTIARHLNNIKYDLYHTNAPTSQPTSDTTKFNAIAKMMVVALYKGTIKAVKVAMPKAILPKVSNKQRINSRDRSSNIATTGYNGEIRNGSN